MFGMIVDVIGDQFNVFHSMILECRAGQGGGTERLLGDEDFPETVWKVKDFGRGIVSVLCGSSSWISYRINPKI
jgi:hypothetical protein